MVIAPELDTLVDEAHDATMRFLSNMRRQVATYWSPAGHDEYGQPTWNAAVELRVRWEDVSDVFLNDRGETQTSRSRVFVGEDVQKGGVLWLGALSTAQGTGGQPFDNPNAFQVQQVSKIPTIKADDFLRIAYL